MEIVLALLTVWQELRAAGVKAASEAGWCVDKCMCVLICAVLKK
jgi:hypothetical protein